MNAKSHRATPEQLEMCRRDPTQADKIIRGLVVCLEEECGEMVARLTRSPKCHARRAHPNVDYEAKWPTAPVYGIGVLEADLQKHYDYLKNNRPLVNVARRKLSGKKLAKAAADPDSKEAAFIKQEHERSSTTWATNYWGAATPEAVKELEAAAKANPDGPEAEKLRAAAEFRKQESKRRKDRAPRDKQSGRELLEARKAAAKADPDGPEAKLLRAQRKKDADEQKEIRRLAHRPKCWDDLEPGTQTLWLIMNEHPGAKGRALGELLDEASIECTHGGGHWADVLGNKKAKNHAAAKMQISRIRNLE
jgi:hypothetical protein